MTDSQKQGYGQKALSQKPMSQKTVPPFLVRPNNNNSIHNKQSLSYERDNTSNNRMRVREAVESDGACEKKECSMADVKKLMGYEPMLQQCCAWTQLKETLGHFSSTQDRDDYDAICKMACDELAYQFRLLFLRSAEQVEISGVMNDRKSLVQSLKANFPAEDELLDYIWELADKRTHIRDVRRYIKKAVLLFAVRADAKSTKRM